MQELSLYRSTPELHYQHLLFDIINTGAVTVILTSENYGQFHNIFLKQGIRMEELIKQKKLQIIDLFSQSIKEQEELPHTEITSKLWIDPVDKALYEQDLYSYLKMSIKHQTVILENLFYLDIMQKERSQYIFQILELLMSYQNVHIYAPIVQISNYMAIINFLSKHATKIITLQANSSGFSRDIDGTMIVEVRQEDMPIIFQKRIYKIEQNNVKYINALQIL